MKDSTRSVLQVLFARYPELEPCRPQVEQATEILIDCYQKGGKLLVCGNGGSAADSQHIVGELMKSFVLPRAVDAGVSQSLRNVTPEKADYMIENLQGALPAISLIGEGALSTAFANDVAPEMCFAQQVLGLGAEGDVLLGISTSGGAQNVWYAAQVARAKGMKVIALTGRDGGALRDVADCSVIVPAAETYQIQEYHLPVYHALCLAVEQAFFGA